MKKLLILIFISSGAFAQVKIPNLPQVTSASPNDFTINQQSAGTPGTTKIITWANLFNSLGVPFGSSFWSTSGNSLAGTGTLGSTNSQPISFITGGNERLNLTTNGRAIWKAIFYDNASLLTQNLSTRLLFDVNGDSALGWKYRTFHKQWTMDSTLVFDNSASGASTALWQNYGIGGGFFIGTGDTKDLSTALNYNSISFGSTNGASGYGGSWFAGTGGTLSTGINLTTKAIIVASSYTAFPGIQYTSSAHSLASNHYNGFSILDKTINDGLYAPISYTSSATYATAPITLTSNTISISQANTTTNGYLSSTDWNTFNGKQNALSGTGFVYQSGSSTSYTSSVGTGSVVLSSGATLTTPTITSAVLTGTATALGTPLSGTLTNCTGLPVAGTLLSAGTGLTLSTNTLSVNASQTQITAIGTATTGTWNATKIGLAYGGTNADLSATGGTSQVLKQTSSGASITVGQLSASDLSNGVASTGSVVLTGGLISYTPTWSNQGGAGTPPSIGNGTITAYYVEAGSRVEFWVDIVAGSTTTFGDNSNRWTISLPVACNSNIKASVNNGTCIGSASGFISGVQFCAGSITISSTTTANIYSNGGSNGWKSDIPATWNTSSSLSIHGSYPK